MAVPIPISTTPAITNSQAKRLIKAVTAPPASVIPAPANPTEKANEPTASVTLAEPVI